MKKIKSVIIEELKKELEHRDLDENYCQWILAVHIKKEKGKKKIEGYPTYTVRMVVKTEECVLVDGMDVVFVETQKGIVEAHGFYENLPGFQGGSVEESLRWLMRKGSIQYLQLEIPFDDLGEEND